jgi:hypothetical protein
MSDLRPLGSEKLQGDDKIKRIIEIANYKNNSNVNENTSEYTKLLADGNTYHIVREKNGYIIKSTVSENTIDYREPIQERKYFSSYSQALKRLNIIAKELNENYGNEKGLSLFSEDTKYVLKQKKNFSPSENLPEVENVPAPPMDNMGPDETPVPPMDDMGSEEIPTPPMDDMGSEEIPTPPMDDTGSEESGDTEDSNIPGSFRVVQKLLGKATQKMRDLQDEDKLSDKDIKYVINTILSAIDLTKLSQDDKDDIIAKFEDEEIGDMSMDMGDEMDVDVTDEDIPEVPTDLPTDNTSEMEEGSWPELASRMATDVAGTMMKKSMGYSPKEKVQSIMDGMFTESKVDSILTKYFKVDKREKKFIQEKVKDKTMNEISRLCETAIQEKKSIMLLDENDNVRFVGKTNKGNLVFEMNNKQIKVTKSGKISE